MRRVNLFFVFFVIVSLLAFVSCETDPVLTAEYNTSKLVEKVVRNALKHLSEKENIDMLSKIFIQVLKSLISESLDTVSNPVVLRNWIVEMVHILTDPLFWKYVLLEVFCVFANPIIILLIGLFMFGLAVITMQFGFVSRFKDKLFLVFVVFVTLIVFFYQPYHGFVCTLRDK